MAFSCIFWLVGWSICDHILVMGAKYTSGNKSAFNHGLILQEPNIISIEELEPSALQSLLPEIPYWIKSPDYERVSIFPSFLIAYLYKLISFI